MGRDGFLMAMTMFSLGLVGTGARCPIVLQTRTRELLKSAATVMLLRDRFVMILLVGGWGVGTAACAGLGRMGALVVRVFVVGDVLLRVTVGVV